MVKEKMKKVVAEINIEETYYADTECPYCGGGNNEEIEMDNITVVQTCASCGKKYKVKIPKDSF